MNTPITPTQLYYANRMTLERMKTPFNALLVRRFFFFEVQDVWQRSLKGDSHDYLPLLPKQQQIAERIAKGEA